MERKCPSTKSPNPTPSMRSSPRHSWAYYGISKERYLQLTKYIKSGKYEDTANAAAREANGEIAGYILLSIMKDWSYDALEYRWQLREMDRIPYGRTDFYGIRRYFYHIFDQKMTEVGK